METNRLGDTDIGQVRYGNIPTQGLTMPGSRIRGKKLDYIPVPYIPKVGHEASLESQAPTLKTFGVILAWDTCMPRWDSHSSRGPRERSREVVLNEGPTCIDLRSNMQQ